MDVRVTEAGPEGVGSPGQEWMLGSWAYPSPHLPYPRPMINFLVLEFLYIPRNKNISPL